jgi:hypothetical protein
MASWTCGRTAGPTGSIRISAARNIGSAPISPFSGSAKRKPSPCGSGNGGGDGDSTCTPPRWLRPPEKRFSASSPPRCRCPARRPSPRTGWPSCFRPGAPRVPFPPLRGHPGTGGVWPRTSWHPGRRKPKAQSGAPWNGDSLPRPHAPVRPGRAGGGPVPGRSRPRPLRSGIRRTGPRSAARNAERLKDFIV